LIPAAALLLADSRTPTGSYAHSGGLEAAVRAGLRAGDVPAFMLARLRTVGATEAALTAAAVRAGEDLGALLALDGEALARLASPPLRAAAGALGRAVLRTGAQLFGGRGTIAAYRERSTATPRAVAFGVVCGAAAIAPADAALVALHDDAAMVAAAAVKLLPLDAGAASGWVAQLAPELGALARAAAAARELPSRAAPLIELRSLAHQAHEGRLFAT
jgi:urease accessory protein